MADIHISRNDEEDHLPQTELMTISDKPYYLSLRDWLPILHPQAVSETSGVADHYSNGRSRRSSISNPAVRTLPYPAQLFLVYHPHSLVSQSIFSLSSLFFLILFYLPVLSTDKPRYF
jgi:hypothetical protein